MQYYSRQKKRRIHEKSQLPFARDSRVIVACVQNTRLYFSIDIFAYVCGFTKEEGWEANEKWCRQRGSINFVDVLSHRHARADLPGPLLLHHMHISRARRAFEIHLYPFGYMYIHGWWHVNRKVGEKWINRNELSYHWESNLCVTIFVTFLSVTDCMSIRFSKLMNRETFFTFSSIPNALNLINDIFWKFFLQQIDACTERIENWGFALHIENYILSRNVDIFLNTVN